MSNANGPLLAWRTGTGTTTGGVITNTTAASSNFRAEATADPAKLSEWHSPVELARKFECVATVLVVTLVVVPDRGDGADRRGHRAGGARRRRRG